MGKKYEYSMNFDLDPSYFGTSEQAKENAKQWMNGINKAVNQLATDYNIPEADMDDIITVASMAPITESGFGTSNYWLDKQKDKDLLRTIGKSYALANDESDNVVNTFGEGAVNIGRAIKRGWNDKSVSSFVRTLGEGESRGFANNKHYASTPTKYLNLGEQGVEQDAIHALYHAVQLYNQQKNKTYYYGQTFANKQPVKMNLATVLSYLWSQPKIASDKNGKTKFRLDDDTKMSQYFIPTDIGVAYQYLALRNGLSRNGQPIKTKWRSYKVKNNKGTIREVDIPNYYKQEGGTINMTQYFKNGNKIQKGQNSLKLRRLGKVNGIGTGTYFIDDTSGDIYHEIGRHRTKVASKGQVYTIRGINGVTAVGPGGIHYESNFRQVNDNRNPIDIAIASVSRNRTNNLGRNYSYLNKQLSNLNQLKSNLSQLKSNLEQTSNQQQATAQQTAVQQPQTSSVNTQRPTTQRLAPRTRNSSSNFAQAFKEARSNGLETFDWNGRQFNTRLSNESVDDWKKNLKPTIETPTIETPTVETPTNEQQVELTPELNAPINRYKTYDGIVGAAMNGNTYSTNTTPYSEWYKRSGNLERYQSDLVKNLIERKYSDKYNLKEDFNKVI